MSTRFSFLTLEQFYGAITFYLAHREDIDRYLATRGQDFETTREAARSADPMFYQKLTDTKADPDRSLNGFEKNPG